MGLCLAFLQNILGWGTFSQHLHLQALHLGSSGACTAGCGVPAQGAPDHQLLHTGQPPAGFPCLLWGLQITPPIPPPPEGAAWGQPGGISGGGGGSAWGSLTPEALVKGGFEHIFPHKLQPSQAISRPSSYPALGFCCRGDAPTLYF